MRRPSLSKNTADALAVAAVHLRQDMAQAHPDTAKKLLLATEFIEQVLEHRRQSRGISARD